jgi:hypothetical protein
LGILPTDAWVEKTYDAALLKRLMNFANIADERECEFTNLVRKWAIVTRMFYQDSSLEPTFKSVETELRRVHYLSKQLRELLSDLDIQYQLWIAASGAKNEDDPETNIAAQDKLNSGLETLQSRAKMAVAAVANKKLGDTNPARRNRIRRPATEELAHIWKIFTGSPPHRKVENSAKTDFPKSYGPFQCFVYEALLPIFEESGVKGIDTDIRYACQRMAKTPSPEPPGYFHMEGLF